MPEFGSSSNLHKATPLQAGVGNADSKRAGYGEPLQKPHYAPVRYGSRALADTSSYAKVAFSSGVLPLLAGTKLSTLGNFYGLNFDDKGDLYLNGGYVTAGSKGVTVDPFRVRHTMNDGEVRFAGEPDEHLILTVTGNALISDGVLLPQFNLSDANISIGKGVGQTILPTRVSTAGIFKTSLGQFTESSFAPNQSGNFLISFCFAGFNVNRNG